MRATFELTCEDYFESYRALRARDRRIRQWAGVAWSLLFFLASTRARSVRGSLACVAIALIVLIGVPAAQLIYDFFLKKRYAKVVAKSGSKMNSILEIYESGIQRPDSSVKVEWPYFSSYSESANDFVLYHANMIDTILPKRAFESQDVEKLRQILNANISRK